MKRIEALMWFIFILIVIMPICIILDLCDIAIHRVGRFIDAREI